MRKPLDVTKRKGHAVGQQSGWQLSGNAPEAYERYIIPALFNEWAHDLVTTAALQAGERVLDVACGTGVVARTAARVVGEAGQVVGVDVNEGMLSMARSIPPPPGTVIRWQQGDAAALPVPDSVFDVVLCQQGLQYFPQRAAALQEMARVLVPGGRLALSVWRPLEWQPFFVALVDAIESYLGAEVSSLQRAAFTLGNAETLRELLTSTGFRAPHIRLVVKLMRWSSLAEYLSGFVAATPMAGAVAAMDKATRRAMFRALQTTLRPYVEDSGLAVPMESHVVVARI
jgi:ubiquinone/menaquinone biosynthesis C-methylase UbiE